MTTRTFLIAGNWKMHRGPAAACELAEGLLEQQLPVYRVLYERNEAPLPALQVLEEAAEAAAVRVGAGQRASLAEAVQEDLLDRILQVGRCGPRAPGRLP